MNISTPDQNEKPTPLKILLMGAPGSYKTTLGLQFPSVHVLDCDRNLEGPKKFLREGYKDSDRRVEIQAPRKDLVFSYDKIRYYDDNRPRKIEECYDACLDVLKVMKPGSDKAYDPCKVVFLDSLSHVNEFIIRKIMSMKKNSTEVDFQTNWWTEFKSFAYAILVSRLEETNRTILCSAHEIKLVESDKDKITQQKVLGYEPFFQGKVGDTIGAFFTDVWRMELRPAGGGRIQTVLQTSRTNFCEHLKNSLGMPQELVLDDGSNGGYKGFKAIEPYLKGKI